MTKFLVILLLCLTPFSAVAQKHRRVPWGPIIRGAMYFTAASLDVQGTQNCIQAYTCVEGNPLMPSTAWKAWSLNLGTAAVSTLIDFKSWRQERRYGMNGPMVGIPVHIIGAVSGWTR